MMCRSFATIGVVDLAAPSYTLTLTPIRQEDAGQEHGDFPVTHFPVCLRPVACSGGLSTVRTVFL